MNAIQYSLAATLFLLTANTHAQSPSIDPALASQIAAIPAIDNHAHPLLSPPAYATDRNFDALPVDNMEPDTDPANLRSTLPALHEAWQALFHFNGQPPLDADGLKQLEAAREATRRQQGEKYATYILDRANIATELANRVAMGTGVQPPRFRWVPYVDALLFPSTTQHSPSPPRTADSSSPSKTSSVQSISNKPTSKPRPPHSTNTSPN